MVMTTTITSTVSLYVAATEAMLGTRITVRQGTEIIWHLAKDPPL